MEEIKYHIFLGNPKKVERYNSNGLQEYNWRPYITLIPRGFMQFFILEGDIFAYSLLV